ncbi:MAG: type II toxin-antitoxin system CcdA family antitoxin [Alphaproteobacteria bacterium]|nr:type II toxin-antitoxin system CcdA family antitoxin [Alphaproteobacteria bacterium]
MGTLNNVNKLFDPKAGKKAVNVTVNQDLLRQAREAGLNLSASLEEKLAEEVRAIRKARWQEENRDAIEAYNRSVEKNGLWSDGYRRF